MGVGGSHQTTDKCHPRLRHSSTISFFHLSLPPPPKGPRRPSTLSPKPSSVNTASVTFTFSTILSLPHFFSPAESCTHQFSCLIAHIFCSSFSSNMVVGEAVERASAKLTVPTVVIRYNWLCRLLKIFGTLQPTFQYYYCHRCFVFFIAASRRPAAGSRLP